MTVYAPPPHVGWHQPTPEPTYVRSEAARFGAALTLTAIVRTRDGATAEIAESAAYDTHAGFMAYVMRCVGAGYRVELVREASDVDPEARR